MSTKKRKQPDSGSAGRETGAVTHPLPPKSLQAPVVDAFPGPRAGFLVAHARASSAGGGASTSAPCTEADVAADAAYISSLITLIPPEFYVAKSEEEKELAWNKYSKNKAGIMPKQSIKESSKKAKRARYDPATQRSVPALQASLEASNVGRAIAEAPRAAGGKAGGGSPKNGRGRPTASDPLLPSVEQSLSFGVLKAKTAAVKEGTSVNVAGVPIQLEPTASRAAAAAAASGKIKPRKVSLKGLLAKAEANQSRLNALKGQVVSVGTGEAAPDEAWESSLKRAAGEKVRDDPSLLRKSIRKEKQKKAKSAKAWADRISAVATGKAERQDKRQENIQKRKDSKKKGGRAGFEGQKRQFLNE